MTIKKAKQATKPAKPVNVTAIGKHIGQQVGELHAGYDQAAKATDAINADIAELRKAKVTIGASRKTCAVANAIYDAMPERLSAGTRANMLSTIRKAVNEGKKFSHNPNRKATGAKGKAKGAKAEGGSIMIAFPKGSDASKAADALRKGFNKMREASDQLAALAAFLTDALDDAGFPADE
jgi:hypothetical protein